MDDEMQSRVEALEMVAIDLLIAARSRGDLALLLASNDDCRALRGPGKTTTMVLEWGDGAWLWRQRLLRLALDATG